MSNLTSKAILKAAGKKGRTKTEIADHLGLSLSHTAKEVNKLFYGGQLTLVGKKGRSDIFGLPQPVAPDTTPLVK